MTQGDPLERLWRHWRAIVLLFWLGTAIFLIWQRWDAIRWFALGDTDDNLRLMQVRALLEGQGWYDLRQYRMNPPFGADIHWSRLVDLPIAGIKLLLTPLVGGRSAETAAVAAAPLLPMLAAMAAMATIARRLVDRRAFLIALALLVCAGSARGMWVPLRIDHHGWQLAMLALVAMALTDPKRGRGGAILGAATAGSLVIGLEMLPYLALAGALAVGRWILAADQARRLAAYGAALAGGCAFGFLVFASEANRAPVCDALSPVWLSAMVAAGAMSVALALLSPARLVWRLAAAAAGGLLLAAAFALAWPDCLGQLEQAPPELERLWLDRVREAMPVWRHGAHTAAIILTLPVAGLAGYALMLWRHRSDAERLAPWASLALLAAVAAGLLMWQTRAGPAAQLLSVPGATALAWAAFAWIAISRFMVVRVAGVVAAFLIVSGIATGFAAELLPRRQQSRPEVAAANGRCPSIPALRAIAAQPAGNVLTSVDLGPRLIAMTPHNAVTGPYHRNSQLILDVMRAWRGDAEHARRIADRYRIDYLLLCPNLSETTIYRADAPDGFYVQLMRGQVPDWLEPVPLPKGSPYRMWRVIR